MQRLLGEKYIFWSFSERKSILFFKPTYRVNRYKSRGWGSDYMTKNALGHSRQAANDFSDTVIFIREKIIKKKN